jgi:putative phage-type endonuclease
MVVVGTPTRSDWLAWRREGIGSSDAAAIAGVDPWRGAMSVYLDKIGELELDSDKPEYMRWGSLLEPAMAEEFERRMGLYIRARQANVEHGERRWQRATVDGLVSDAPHNTATMHADYLGIYEAKTSAGFKDAQWAEGVPDHYRVQVQHQLAVTGFDHAWLAVLHGGNRFTIHEVDRDEKVVELLNRIEGVFWRENVLGRRPPDVDGMESSTEAIKEAFRRVELGKVVDLGEEGPTLLDNLRYARESVTAAEKQLNRAQQAVMLQLGEAEGGAIEGRVAVTWRQHSRTSIDLDALRNQEPALAQKFEKTSTYRQLRLKGE